MTDQLNDPNLDAIGRRERYAIVNLSREEWDALIQRLREAEAFGHEAERVVSRKNQELGGMERRIAQLERVRQAAQMMLVSLDMNSIHQQLRAALAAVEEEG